MATLYVTHGITGSGKSTFSIKFCNEKNILRFSHDEIMITLFGKNPPVEFFPMHKQSVTNLLKQIAQELLSKNIDIFLDLAMLKKSERAFWRETAKQFNAKFNLFYVKCPTDIALQRTLERTRTMPEGVYAIDEKAFNIINNRIEPLEDWEEHIIIDGCDV